MKEAMAGDMFDIYSNEEITETAAGIEQPYRLNSRTAAAAAGRLQRTAAQKRARKCVSLLPAARTAERYRQYLDTANRLHFPGRLTLLVPLAVSIFAFFCYRSAACVFLVHRPQQEEAEPAEGGGGGGAVSTLSRCAKVGDGTAVVA